MDRVEAGLRAQTGEKPGGGYYTGSERITLQKFSLGRITTLPRSVFGGRIVGGGGGAGVGGGGAGGGTTTGSAIVVRPQVSLVDRAQDLRIQTTQQTVGGLQQSLDVIRVQVTELNQGVQNTAKLLQQESVLEQNQLKQEQEAERRLAERRVRVGKESALEKNIQAALIRPIAKLQQTITSVFDRIMGSLTTLFFGWLTNQGIETLKAFTEGNTKKLEEIKNNVIKNVLFAIGGFAAVNIGFGLLMRTITGLTLRLASFATKIAFAPFRLAGAAIGGLLGFGRGMFRPPGRVPITTSGGNVLGRGGMMSRFLGGIRNIGKGTQGVLRGAGNVASRIFTPLALGVGTYRIAQGDITGGLLSYASAVPIIGLPALGIDIAREYGAFEGTFLGKNTPQQQSIPPKPESTKVAPTQPQAPPPAAPTPAAQPQMTAIPSASEITFNVDASNMMQTPQQSLATNRETTSPYGMVNIEGLFQEKKPSAEITPPPKPTTPVGTLPEPKPNIIMAGGGRDRTQTVATQQEPLTDVPFIPSFNTDNFYVLYSQMNYNVVM